ncbi:MAG: hypothetical protein IJU01_04550 [Lachnospiraceae bacterium]|nr:hypothetical protein [Lachnospiraceae bacterium]
MAEKRTQSALLEEQGNRLIQSEPLLRHVKNSKAKIMYLESDAKRKRGRDKLVYGQCEKVSPKNRWAITADFLIVLYAPNIEGLNEKQIEILLFHELLHIGVEEQEDGTEDYYLRNHDVEEFEEILAAYGKNWSSKV